VGLARRRLSIAALRVLDAGLLGVGLLGAGLLPGRHVLARPLPKLTAGCGQQVVERDVPAPRHEQPVKKVTPGWDSRLTTRPGASNLVASFCCHQGFTSSPHLIIQRGHR
jgi:hypothetical protein